jgi:2-amino-4-hydroxy-6-hydroxymethyldihydropteridine diphosphokinase
MTEVYLAIGGNVGNVRANIEKAAELLGQNLADVKLAAVYASKAVGYTDQPDFFNTAICGQTDLAPEELLKFVKEVEGQVGRTASFRWGPREIDIDVIFYGNQIIKTGHLTIPHPEYSRRDFVLKPLLDLNPDLKDPMSERSLQFFLDKLPESGRSLV